VQARLPYELPGALEAATVILLHYVRREERLYTDNPWTWGRELIDKICPVVGGGFSSGGLDVRSCLYGAHKSFGVDSLRKF
jgi:hypothetical protein